MNFKLTLKQLENIVTKADNEDWEDIIEFKVEDGRLKVSQSNWANTTERSLMNKPN